MVLMCHQPQNQAKRYVCVCVFESNCWKCVPFLLFGIDLLHDKRFSLGVIREVLDRCRSLGPNLAVLCMVGVGERCVGLASAICTYLSHTYTQWRDREEGGCSRDTGYRHRHNHAHTRACSLFPLISASHETEHPLRTTNLNYHRRSTSTFAILYQ